MEETLLSIHPVEEVGYVGVAFWHLLISSNPILAKSAARTTTSCTTPDSALFLATWASSRLGGNGLVTGVAGGQELYSRPLLREDLRTRTIPWEN
jgi:hypothetical protein